uniref:Uncharacterized protein n=1 Tax=Vitis vinifera TaxID=29760 RepID=A5BRE1_VITVI|nr:hypothetical protein VITISV_032947 [Vitis vinifera]
MENFHHTSWVHRPLFWEPLSNTFFKSCYMELLDCMVAITFSGLHAGIGLKSLNEFLYGKAYIARDHLTKDDVNVYAVVPEWSGSHFPNANKRKAIGVRVGCQATPVEATPNEVKEVAPAGDDDDDLDLCGDETEKEGPYYMRTGSCKYGAHV